MQGLFPTCRPCPTCSLSIINANNTDPQASAATRLYCIKISVLVLRNCPTLPIPLILQLKFQNSGLGGGCLCRLPSGQIGPLGYETDKQCRWIWVGLCHPSLPLPTHSLLPPYTLYPSLPPPPQPPAPLSQSPTPNPPPHALPWLAMGREQGSPAPPRPSTQAPPRLSGTRKPRPGPGARSQAKPSLPPLIPSSARGRQPNHLKSCGLQPRRTQEVESDMAAAKPENLSLVVHGPGDLRLVKLEWEWEVLPVPALFTSKRSRGLSWPIPARCGPHTARPGRPDRIWLPCWGEGHGRRLVLRC